MSNANQPSLGVEISELEPQVAKVLPAHISPARFMRVVQTAIVQDPELRAADRASLLTACVQCATDGLVPDKREAALVIYNTKVGNGWVKKAQYLPMVFGILKLIRQSGEIKSFACDSVYSNDSFEHWVDDDGEHIRHEQLRGRKSLRGDWQYSYAMFTTHDGGRFIEVIDADDMETIRSKSKSAFDKDGKLRGPWLEFADEMRIKSAIHRLFKRAPVSTEIDRTIRRLDDHYDIEGEAVEVSAPARTSGREAARAALGVIPPTPVPGAGTVPPAADPVPEGDGAAPPAQAAAPTEPPPSQDEVANLIARLQKCKSVEAVDKLLAAFPMPEAYWPLALAAKADEMRETLSKQ